jgi:hypothetical protein
VYTYSPYQSAISLKRIDRHKKWYTGYIESECPGILAERFSTDVAEDREQVLVAQRGLVREKNACVVGERRRTTMPRQ